MTQPDPPRRSLLRRGMTVVADGIRRHPWWFLVGVLGATAYAAGTVLSAFVIERVTDRVLLPAIETGEVAEGAVATAAVAIVAVALLRAVGVVFRRVGALQLQFLVQGDHRRELVERFQRLPLSWLRRRPTGEMLSLVNADVEAASHPLGPLPWSIGVFPLLGGSIAALAVTDLAIAAVALAMAPTAMVLNRRFNDRIERILIPVQQLRAKVATVAHGSLGGAIVVKTLGREREEVARFRNASEQLRERLVAAARIRALYDATMQALPQIATLVAILVAAWRFTAGALSAGELVGAAYLFNLIAFPVRVIGYFLGDLSRGVVGWERVHEVLRAPDRVTYGDRRLDGGPRGAAVAFEKVSFRHGDRDILREVSFEVPPGRVAAIVGPTGAGKSTIASLLARLLDPHGGTVRVDGTDLRAVRRDALATDVAIVLQDAFLFDDTVRFNITLGEDFGDDEVRSAARLAHADEFVDGLPDGYDTRIGEGGATLSGGQRQRIALARALVRRPRLLILDDATSSLDATVEAEVIRRLKEASLGSTIVMIGHRPATAAVADQVVQLEEGEVVGTDSADEEASLGESPEGRRWGRPL